MTSDPEQTPTSRAEAVAADVNFERDRERMPAPGDSEARLRAILDTAACGIITIDASGIVETTNPACDRLFGLSAGEIVGKNIKVLMPSPDREKHQSYLERYLETGEKRIIGSGREVTARRKDGSTFPVILYVSEFCVDGRRMFTGVVDDITGRKRAEDELQKRIRQQEVVAELGVLALAQVDLDELMNTVVTRVAHTLGVELSKVLELTSDGDELLLRAGFGWRDGLVGEATVGVGEDSQAGYTLAHDTQVIVEDLRNETRFSGPLLLTEHGVVSGMSVVILGEGRPFGVLGAHTSVRRHFGKEDVHFLQSAANVVAEAVRRRAAEKKLVEHQNLVQLGEMAGVVAHEVKNTQAGVSGALQIIRERLPEDSRDRDVIPDMLKRLESLNKFMGDVLTFARPRTPVFSVLPVTLLLEETVAVVSENPRFEGIDVSLEGDDLAIPFDPDLLRPVLVNLLLNAAESMDASGRITIDVCEYHEPRCPSYCRVSVTDTGSGMSDDVRKAAFEPFFSTKHRGSGLGLSIAQRVVELHGGRISISSPNEGGTRLVLDLPLSRES